MHENLKKLFGILRGSAQELESMEIGSFQNMAIVTVLGVLGLSENYLKIGSENMFPETKRSMLSMGVGVSDKEIPFLTPSVSPTRCTEMVIT